ncbi:MAG: tRNA (N6-isopentenyl adenosine(37)-C2)-methylthiotransferase MiaB [Bacteroidales bacterium]
MNDKKLYIETYGCQMNFSDSEIVASILRENEYVLTGDAKEANLILVNTCSIREKAEDRVWKRLRELKSLKKKNPALRIGVIGCMAERLHDKLLTSEFGVDLVAGPDAYRSLPYLVEQTATGAQAANIQLSLEETYADIEPVRLDASGITAFVSIMRGCDNFCAYCVVPFTRGRERSRSPHTIVEEVQNLWNKGYREVTLLGQNVNSYHFAEDGITTDFPDLLARVASIDPQLRVRFTTSHPKDLSDKLIETIATHPNICRSIHLAVQSGSNAVLKRMNRKYTREWFLDRVRAIRTLIPDCTLSTDIIAGYCGETEEDHRQTLSLMEEVRFDAAFMFRYSEREGTIAAKKYKDDVPDDVKGRRLQEIIDLQHKHSLASNRADVGKVFEVLAEGHSKRNKGMLSGRNSQNKVVVFKAEEVNPGDYVQVRITGCTSATLMGEQVKEPVGA